MIAKLAYLGILILVALSLPARAEIDDYHSAILREYVLPLKWENVKDHPFWMGGEEYCYDAGLGRYAYNLKPGKFIIVRLPREEKIHIVSLDQNSNKDNLSIYASNGTGLYVKRHLTPGPNDKTWVYESESQSVNVVKIVNNSDCDESKIAVFLSKRYPINQTIKYTNEIDLSCSDPINFIPGYYAGVLRWFQIDPNKTAAFTIKGPARINVQSRFRYPSKESSLFQAWRIDIAMDNAPLRSMRFHSTHETQYPMLLDGHRVVASEEENGYINIPPGDHVVKLKSSGPLYLRVSASYCEDYLFHANDPANSNQDPDVTLFELENKAYNLVWDNRYQSGGVVGMAILNKFYQKRPDLDPLKASYDKLFEIGTFYRDILPEHKYSDSEQRFYWFVHKSLLDVDQYRLPLEVNQQFLSTYVDRFQGAFFNAVPEDPDSDEPKILKYALPIRTVPTWARIVVELNEPCYDQTLWMQLDDCEPYEIQTSEIANFANKEYLVTETEGALCLLEQRFCERGKGTLSEGFNYFRPIKAPMKDAGIFEFQVPEGTRSIKVWKKIGLSKPLKIALQFRDARAFSLTENDYLTLINDEKNKYDLLSNFMAALKSYPNVQENELTNNFLPVIRLIGAEYRLMLASVVDPDSTPKKKAVKNSVEYNKQLAKGKKEIEQGNTLAAVTTLGSLTSHDTLLLHTFHKAPSNLEPQTVLLRQDLLKAYCH